MRGRLAVATVLVASAAVACGTQRAQDPVVAGSAPAAPYGGPLSAPAARALECDAEVYSRAGSDPWSRGDGGSTPEEGLRAYFDIQQPDVPRHGYRVERGEADRVLYSFDVDGRTKVAVIVAKDRRNRPGWGPESSASCDPAELPASFTDTQPYEIWTDTHNRRVPVARVTGNAGPEHCDWQKAHLLSLGAGGGKGRLYARDPDGVLPEGSLLAPYDGDARMPADAHDTGYRYGDWRLWLTEDTSKAYVRTSHGVEAWPRVRDGFGCK
ncbi:hypothetical protein ABZT17_44460 [Streptomyces sp. NPDC005648]|uniref:hypothetical protein n=1 Tax=Streptomyces sp. NPDC005648 TaxID=3157044 RepID=UPI0033A5FD22